jgi:hypothetical protein
MGKHLRKNFSTEEVVEIFERYLNDEIGVNEAYAFLKISRRQFFDVLKKYRDNPNEFNLQNERGYVTRYLPVGYEEKIEEALKEEKELIDDKYTPIRRYNYSYVKTQLENKDVTISLSTIIRRAKKKGFTNKNNRRKITTEKF